MLLEPAINNFIILPIISINNRNNSYVLDKICTALDFVDKLRFSEPSHEDGHAMNCNLASEEA